MDRDQFAERLAGLRETRARLPELVRNRHASRRRRPVAGHSARLLLIEVDAPARGEVAAAAGAAALADRPELLFRVANALEAPGVDGVVGTADVIDDLLLLEHLEDHLAFGSMNPGEPFGARVGEHFTGYDADTIAASHLDGGLLHLPLTADGPGDVLERAGREVTALAGHSEVTLVEPAWYAGSVEDRSAAALQRAVGVASGLGGRSPFLWLVLPDVDVLADVLPATTLPVLVRVAEDPGDLATARQRWRAVLDVPGIRGFVVPAACLFASGEDPLAVVEVVADVLRQAYEAGPSGP